MDFIQITIVDVIDILLVATIMYYIYRVTKGTNAPSIIIGIVLVYLLWVVVKALNMELLSAILGHFIGVGVIAIIVVFQPEIRRFLQMIGQRQRRNNFIARIFASEPAPDKLPVEAIVRACTQMAASKTGALIVLQQASDLRLIVESGIELDAEASSPLLCNIFFKNAPLHDGAAVIHGERILAAKCILPTTQQTTVPKAFGTRHRAALGMSEVSDAIVLVVSEETGGLSIAQNGNIKRDIAPDNFQPTLERYLRSSEERTGKGEERFFSKFRRRG